MNSGGMVFYTTLHLAVSRDGAADETTAIANTWALIHPLAVTNWAGSPLVYYRPDVVGFSAACPLGPLADMLQAGTGRCGTFAALFQSALDRSSLSP